MSELKKCPFCGKVPKVESYNSAETLFIVTHQCGVMRHAALSIHVGYDSEMYLTRTTKKAAIAAWNRRADHSGEANGTMTLEEISASIQIICHNGGCPPDKDCEDKQDCHKCIMNWLAYRQKPNGGEG